MADKDRLEKATAIVEAALATTDATNFAARPVPLAAAIALRLGAAIALTMLDLAESARVVRRLFEEEARKE